MGAREERASGLAAILTEVLGELVDVELDVRAHHVVAHLDGVLADVRHYRRLVRTRERQALANRRVDRMRLLVADVVAHQDRPERNRQQRHVLPPLAQVGNRDQPGIAIGEARLVNDQPGIDLAVRDCGYDPIEAHLHGLRTRAERKLQQHERRRALSRNRDPLAREFAEEWGRFGGARDQQRAAAAPDRAAGGENAIAIHQKRNRAVAHFGELELAARRRLVEFLDVGEMGAHLRRAVEQPVRQRGEDIGVVRARRVRQRVRRQ